VIAIARRSAEVLPPETEARMGEFAELAAQAIANAEAREQLAASRARLVQAGDEARRRIERNLHDGAQQRIVSLALLLRVAERATADEKVATLLARASEELQLVAQELRELARGIHPAVLSEHGLRPALDALVARAHLPVELEADFERLPPAIEATTYYVLAEALTNITKYAEATSARVSVRAREQLEVEIADDGTGGAVMDGDGGLRGLADRVEALSGTFAVDSPRGAGTRISATIPLP
jgi:signal transduction histidine kinase